MHNKVLKQAYPIGRLFVTVLIDFLRKIFYTYFMKNKKLFLFDIDGVIRLGDKIIDGSIELFEQIQKNGGKSIFLTNNSTKSSHDYVQTFIDYGFRGVDKTNFLTALDVAGEFLLSHHKDDLIFAFGTKSFKNYLKSKSLKVTCDPDEKNLKVVIVGYNNEMTYQDICDVCKVLQTTNAEYYATNMDTVCPVTFGFIPDCGAICDFIFSSTNKKPKFLGKPTPDMINLALNQSGYKKEQTVMVGDRLYTDIACGINAQVDTILVLTGEAKLSDLDTTPYKPTFVYNSVKDIFSEIK